jgi:hypothetical protein
MFTTVYTLKFACKAEGLFDFKVSTLECLYLSPPETPMAEWQWRLLSRIPNEVLGPMVTTIKKTIAEKKGLDVSAVKRLRWKEGSALQVLHVGPYDQVCETYNQLMEHAAQHGLVVGGPAHEIYLSDPRRVAPEKLRTIVRLGVKKK